MANDQFNRREFIKLFAYSSMAMSLPVTTGCDVTPKPTQTVVVSLVKDSDDSTGIRRAIELVDGLDFLSPGDSVLLKLALNSPSPFPATTSPEVVSDLVTLLKERGAGDVFVADKSPEWQDTIQCMEETGIYDAARSTGAEVVSFEDVDMVAVRPEGALHWPKGFSMPKIFNRVDHIIVLPTLRTHGLAWFTMGMKSFVGAIPQPERMSMHRSSSFFQRIAEIHLSTNKIRLSLLDARQGFNTEGPDSGNLIFPGIMIASQDIVAADAVGLALLKSIGTTERLMRTRVWNNPTIKRGVELRPYSLTPDSLDILSEGIDTIEEIRQQLV